MTQCYLVDTETTGLTDPIEVISLATAPITNDLSPCDTAPSEEFFTPSKPLEWGAMATHGILMADLEGKRPASAAKLPSDCTHIIAHNADFDWKALGQPPVKRICTLALARDAWPKLDSHTLGALMYYVCGPTPETRELLKGAHGAAVDVGLLAMLLPTFIDEFEATSVEHLWQLCEEARIPKIMSFGKYKGRPVHEVDGGWISWYRRQEDPDQYLLKAFKRIGR